MEPLLIILIPGVLGGLALALLIFFNGAFNRSRTPTIVVPRRLESPSPSLINMASIRIEGLGGLGMVAAVVAVAVSDPRIRLATIAAAILGAGLALVLIAMRRRTGALPSSGDGPEDQLTLSIDSELRRMYRAREVGTIDPVEPGRSRIVPMTFSLRNGVSTRNLPRAMDMVDAAPRLAG
jgi:hypothetical protein